MLVIPVIWGFVRSMVVRRLFRVMIRRCARRRMVRFRRRIRARVIWCVRSAVSVMGVVCYECIGLDDLCVGFGVVGGGGTVVGGCG